MAYYDVTAFAGTTIVTANRKQVSMVETDFPVTRLVTLENGAILDADGSADSDLQLGEVIVRYQIIPDANGMLSLDSHVAALEAMRLKRGTLTGKQYGASTVTETCTARCMDVAPEPYAADSGPPMAAGNKQRVFVVVRWQKLTSWA